MKWPIFYLILLFSFSSMAQLDRTDIEKILPSELVKTISEKDISEIETRFKQKIYKKETDAIYLNYFGKNGDVTIGMKNNKVAYIYVKIPPEIQKKNHALFDKAYDSLSNEEKKTFNKNIAKETSHQKGRFTLIDLSKKSMKLEFYNDELRTLHSILLWPLGEKLP